jgi:hypothetical protein
MSMKTITYRGGTYCCPYADLLRPLTSDEYDALKASIKSTNGVKVPVIIDDKRNVIDGQHRLEIAAELNVHCMFEMVDADEDEKRRLAIELNLHRRQFSKDDVRNAVAQLLKNDPGQSDRAIAEKTKVDHKTVGAARRKLESTGEIPQLNGRRGQDGKVRETKTPTLPEKTQTCKNSENATPQPKKRAATNDDGVGLRDYISRATGTVEGTAEVLAELNADAWKVLAEEHPNTADRLIQSCFALATAVGGQKHYETSGTQLSYEITRFARGLEFWLIELKKVTSRCKKISERDLAARVRLVALIKDTRDALASMFGTA